MLKDLDPLLLNQIRLGVMSLLVSLKEAEFNYLREELKCTAGNLSAQLQKLKDAGYIDIEKTFKNNYPLTTCRITKKGLEAFRRHFEHLKSYKPFK
ncbi:MAG: transcriptional regulator [Bacteroidia bacterium]|nr:transcriptional regulator [Bacteroidia bacterium]